MRIKRAPREQRTSSDGIFFDSLSEIARWEQLRILERAGQIRDLRRQVKFPLEISGRPILIRSEGYPAGRRCSYTADFSYYESVNPDVLIVEERKGIWTDAARLRIAVAECIYGFRVVFTGTAKLIRRKKWRAPQNKI